MNPFNLKRTKMTVKQFSLAWTVFALVGLTSFICKANSQISKGPSDSKNVHQMKNNSPSNGQSNSLGKSHSKSQRKAKTPRTESLAKKWSLKYLARASNTLLVINDHILAKEKAICSLEKKQLRKVQQNLKIIIDEKIASLKPTQVQDIVQMSETCEQSCSCDIFSYYFEKGTEHQHKSYAVLAAHKAQATATEDRLQCAKKFKEFCKSDLMTALKK